MSYEKVPKFILRLMPGASAAEHRQAAENFREYMKVVLNIYERIVQEQLDSPESQFRDRVDDTDTT